MAARLRIALCMNFNDFWEYGIARGIVRFARECGRWQLFGYGRMLHPVQNLRRWRGDGIISRVKSKQEAARLLATKLPVVDVAGAVLDAGFYQVNNDDYATGHVAAQQLLAAGFRTFAFCGVAGVSWSELRRRGFCDAVRAVVPKIPVFEERLLWYESPVLIARFRGWLKALPKPCAIFACNDSAGSKVTSTCAAARIPVPDDIAVIGVDNEGVLCELSSPTLSSIPCDTERIGYEAAARLDAILTRRECTSGTVLVPPLPPVVRESTARLATRDPLVCKAVQFMREQIPAGINVADVVRHVAASRRNLELRFRRELDVSIHDEIIRSRLDRACRLLLDENLPIAKIALLSGFSSHQRFHNVFRAHLKSSPLAFRRRGSRVVV